MPSLKQELKEALADADYNRVAELAKDHNRVFGLLVQMAYDKSDVVSWRAIEAMGVAVKASDPDRPEIVRNVVRRLIASAREESGGMSWSAPELLAEIVSARPKAFVDIPPIIVSLHEEDEENVFRKGVLWALGTMAASGIDDVAGASEILSESLDSEDPSVRGTAAWAAGKIGPNGYTGRLKELTQDSGRFRLYEDGVLRDLTVGEAAAGAL